jgi:hypothetical protein
MTPEQEFENELEIFRTETQTAVQFFYAYLTIHAVARDRPTVHRLLNQAPLFWNTNLGALQTGSFIVLGRIFDQTSRHNVDHLLKIGQTNLGIFNKAALGARKQRDDPGATASAHICRMRMVQRQRTFDISDRLSASIVPPTRPSTATSGTSCSPTMRYLIRRTLVGSLREQMFGNSSESYCSCSPSTMRYGCFL